MRSNVLVYFLFVLSVKAQQLTFKNCAAYKPINASNYDKNPSSANPFGYFSQTLPYMDGQKTTPCVEVTGIPDSAYIEIKMETITTGAKICVGDERTLRSCGQGSLSTCYSAPSTTTKFAFYCDTACEQVDVSFWYRFVISEANPSDQWCEGRPSDDYPSALVSVPTNLPTSSTKKSINAATHHNASVALILFSIIFMAAILFELNQ